MSVFGHQLSPRLWRPTAGKHLCYNPVIHTKKTRPSSLISSNNEHSLPSLGASSQNVLAAIIWVSEHTGVQQRDEVCVSCTGECVSTVFLCSVLWVSVSRHIWPHLVQVVMLAVRQKEAPAIDRWVFKIEPLFFFCIWYLNIHTSQHSQVYNH